VIVPMVRRRRVAVVVMVLWRRLDHGGLASIYGQHSGGCHHSSHYVL
jgi:hypothetical protein